MFPRSALSYLHNNQVPKSATQSSFDFSSIPDAHELRSCPSGIQSYSQRYILAECSAPCGHDPPWRAPPTIQHHAACTNYAIFRQSGYASFRKTPSYGILELSQNDTCIPILRATNFSSHAWLSLLCPNGASPGGRVYTINNQFNHGSVQTSSGPRPKAVGLVKTKKIAGFDASTNTSGTLFGGIESQWLAEEGTASVTNPDVRQITLKAKKLALLCTTSNELLADGMNISGQLNEGLSTANSWFLDYAFLRGTGAGQPLGVLNDPALVSVAEESEQDSDSIVYENLTKMLARLHPGCFQNAVWIANPTCIPELLQMSYTVGVAGSHVKVLDQLPDGWRMLTRPVLFTEKLPTLGDKGDIMLVDFSQYAIGLRKEITIEKSGHVYFTSDKTAWRAITRIDGQGRWDGPFTPANGDTQSWCVCLDARE